MFLRAAALVAAAATLFATSRPAEAAAGNPNAAIVQKTDAFVSAINAGDEKALAALFVPDAVLCDEVPPYRWTGPNAALNWLHDDARLITRHKILNATITVSPPTFVHASGTGAYVVRPLLDAYTVGGKRQHETGLLTFVLVKENSVWRISLMCFAKTGDTSDASWNGE
jgi:ketosteroid isomerase-like protein